MARFIFGADEYTVGPTGGFLDFRAATGKYHQGVDAYPRDVRNPARAPELVRVLGIRTTLDGPGILDGYGPGALWLESADELAERFVQLKRWHVLAHLEPEDVARFAVGAILEEGQAVGRVFVPRYQNTGWRHCHAETRRQRDVPSGNARRPFLEDMRAWAKRRNTIDGLVAGGAAVAVALAAVGLAS